VGGGAFFNAGEGGVRLASAAACVIGRFAGALGEMEAARPGCRTSVAGIIRFMISGPGRH
jgi:hypothetical protein